MKREAFGLFLLLTLLLSFSLTAQEESNEELAEEAEEVVVTGSRIKRSNFETNAPVTVIGSPELLSNTFLISSWTSFSGSGPELTQPKPLIGSPACLILL